jgi:hypothetical protein
VDEKLEQDVSDPLRIVDDFLRQYDSRAIDVRPKPASREQVQLGFRLSAVVSRYRTLRLQYDYKNREMSLKIQKATDDKKKITDISDLEYRRLEALWREKSECALELLTCIDLVKGQGMVHDSISATDELKKCTSQAAELREQLRDAQQRIVELERLVRLLGGNPDDVSRFFTGDVEEGD